MTTIPTGAAWRPYVRTLAESGLDVASAGAWIAAAELPPARRRLARGALAAITLASGIPAWRATRGSSTTTEPAAGSPLPIVDVGIELPVEAEAEGGASSRRRAVTRAAVVTVAVAVPVGAALGVRQLEKRWLARLARNGHPHPHRALGVRMAALYAVLVVPGRLYAVHRESQV